MRNHSISVFTTDVIKKVALTAFLGRGRFLLGLVLKVFVEVVFVVPLFSVDLLDSAGRKDRPGSVFAHESVLLLCEIVLIIRRSSVSGFSKDQFSLVGGRIVAAVFGLEDLFLVGPWLKQRGWLLSSLRDWNRPNEWLRIHLLTVDINRWLSWRRRVVQILFCVFEILSSVWHSPWRRISLRLLRRSLVSLRILPIRLINGPFVILHIFYLFHLFHRLSCIILNLPVFLL